MAQKTKSEVVKPTPFKLPWGPAWNEELKIIEIGQDAYWAARRAMNNETQAVGAAIRAACQSLVSGTR